MLGTTFRLGFDGSAVNRGLGGIGSLLGRFSQQVGIGAARKIGYGMTDMIGRIASAVPEAIKDLTMWGGELSDMSAQTRIAAKDLMLLYEAMRLAGAAPSDVSRQMSQLAAKIHEAATVIDSPAGRALKALKFDLQELRGVPIDQAFYRIGARFAEMGDEIEGAEKIMSELFGGIRGAKMLRFFRAFDKSISDAKRNMATWADVAEGDISDNLDEMADAMGRWDMVRRRMAFGLLKGIGGGSIDGFGASLNNIYDWLSSIGPLLEDAGRKMRSFLGTAIEVIAKDGLLSAMGGFLENMGRKIGVGIARGIVEAIDFTPKGWGFIKGVLGGGLGTYGKTKTSSVDPEAVMRDQLRVLNLIERKVGVAKFA